MREEWAREHGLKDVAEPAFDEHLAAVQERLSVNLSSSAPNLSHEVIVEGAEKLGLGYTPVERNWSAGSHDPEVLGATGFGDRSGGKQSADRTYLADAVSAGAVVVERCAVQQVLTESGRATGVEALRTGPDGTQIAVTVRAPRVVVAAGALESPAVLLRSGLGGPAVGQSLHVHPSIPLVGDYGRDVRAWEGAPQAGVIDQFQETGFLIELIHYSPSMSASAMPLVSGEQHKETMLSFRNCVPSVVLTRDRSSGRIVVDEDGKPVVTYVVNDPADLETIRRGVETSVRLHVAAGARRVIAVAEGAPTWQEGEDLDAYLQALSDLSVGAGGWTIVAAHQMGSCRMGTDPTVSVADTGGQLHDTKGVWIGDSSALPTALGVNPMITIMALARRTARSIIDDEPTWTYAETTSQVPPTHHQ